MGTLKGLLHKYLTDDIIRLYEFEEKAGDMSGWMLNKGFSKRTKKTIGKLSHYEYVLTEEGKNFLKNEYPKQYDKLLSLIKNDNPENESHLLSEIKAFIKNNYDEYVEQKGTLSRQESLVLRHFEKQI
jgi:hypothetical protein